MRSVRTSNDLYPPRADSSSGMWYPPVEVFETYDRPVLPLEVLTVHPEDMDAANEDGALILYVGSGQEIDTLEGAFTCSFLLPTEVEPARRKTIEITPT